MRAVLHLVVADLQGDSGTEILLARPGGIASPRQYHGHESFGVVRGGGKHPAFHRGPHEGFECVSGAHQVGDIRKPSPVVRIAHDKTILRIEQHEAFRDRFQRIRQLAPGAVELLGQALFGSDIAGGSRNAVSASVLVPAGDAVLPCPMPGPIGMPVAILDLEALGLSLEMSDDCRAVVRQVIRMDPINPLSSRREFLGRQCDEVVEARRVIHLAASNVPLIDGLVDRLHGSRVALLAVAQGLLHASSLGHIADATDEPNRAPRRVADRQTMVLDPSIIAVARLDAVFARDLGTLAPEAFAQRVAIGFGMVGMNP